MTIGHKASRSRWVSGRKRREPRERTTMSPSGFDAFCRHAFEFLEYRGVRYLVIGGLAVVVVGEPRITADADAVVFTSPAEAESLIREAAAAGFDLREDVERERLSRTGTIRFRRGALGMDE